MPLMDIDKTAVSDIRHLAAEVFGGAAESMLKGHRTGGAEPPTPPWSIPTSRPAAPGGDRLNSVTQRIGEIDGMNQSVATATEEQTAVVEAINQDISEINTLNQEGVDNLQSTLRACSELESQVSQLKQLVGSFRI